MKKVLLVLLAIVAMAGTKVEAKSFPRTPVGSWVRVIDNKSKTRTIEGMEQDTTLTCTMTAIDSLSLSKRHSGNLTLKITRRYVYTTEDGYEKVEEEVDNYFIFFDWKYKKGNVQMGSCWCPMCVHIFRESDNRAGASPTQYNAESEEYEQQLIMERLANLDAVYFSKTGRLYSYGQDAYFERCEGKRK